MRPEQTVAFSVLQEHGPATALPSAGLPACPALSLAVASPFSAGPKLLMPLNNTRASFVSSSALVALDCRKLVVRGHGDRDLFLMALESRTSALITLLVLGRAVLIVD